MSWPESVDEALCVGWIDTVRRRIDDESYTIRFARWKATSTWSAVNIRRMAELLREGRVLPPGKAAFEKRSVKKSKICAYEQKDAAARIPLPANIFNRSRPPGSSSKPYHRRTVTS